MKHHITFTVNGDPVEALCETEQTLLDVLRDELELTGTKEGCATGDCGACSVLVDGRLVCSCLMLGTEMKGQNVRLAAPNRGTIAAAESSRQRNTTAANSTPAIAS